MKKQYSKIYLFSCMLVLILSGCVQRDVDLENIDTRAQLETSLAVPIGTITASVEDILDINAIKDYLTISGDTIFFRDTFLYSQEYHSINLKDYMTDVPESDLALPSELLSYIPAGMSLNISDVINLYNVATGKDITEWQGQADHDIQFSISNMNIDLSAATTERIDYAEIESARFTITINPKNMGGLSTDNITNLTLYLPDSIFIMDDNTLKHTGSYPHGYYEMPIIDSNSSYNFNNGIPIILNNFKLLLRNDIDRYNLHNIKDAFDFSHFIDKVGMGIHFEFKFDKNSNITLSSNSSISYKMTIDFLEYGALYGYFRPPTLMSDTNEINLSEETEVWAEFRKFKVPLAEPEIKLEVITSVGAPLQLDIHKLYSYTLDNPNNKVYARWDNADYKTWPMPNFVKVTDPLDAVSNNVLPFNQKEGNGQIHRLFNIQPDVIGYAFETNISQESVFRNVTQHRLNKNTKVYVNTYLNVPLVFEKGVKITHSDTITNVSINALSLDSLIEQNDFLDTVNTAKAKLYVMVKSEVPFDIDGNIRFLDKNNREINSLKLLNDGNNIKFLGASTTEYIKNGEVIKPRESMLIFDIEEKELSDMSKIDHIICDYSIGNNEAKCILSTKQTLSLTLGLTADVSAIVKIPQPENDNNK